MLHQTLDAPAPAAGKRPEPIGRPFHVHLASTALANLADGIVLVGIPLLAVSLTRSPQEISLLQALFWLPWLLFGLVSGVVIDRTDRRVVRIVAMSLRVLLLIGLAALAATGNLSIGLLLGFMGLYGITQVFADLAARTIVPQLVPVSRLAAANGRTMAAERVFDDFIGRPIGGLLVVLGSGWLFGAAAAIGIAVVLLLVFGLKGRFRARADVVPAERTRPLRAVREGLGFVSGHPVLRPIIIMAALANLATTAYMAVFVLWVVGPGSAIGLTEAQYPLVMVATAAGAVLATFAIEPLKNRIPEVPLMLSGWMAQVPLLVLPVFFPRLDVLLVAMVLNGFCNMTGNALAMTLTQKVTPGRLLGRVNGAVSTLSFGLMPIGAVLGGLLGERFGLPTVFIASALLLGAAVLYAMLAVSRRAVSRRAVGTRTGRDLRREDGTVHRVVRAAVVGGAAGLR